MIRKRSWKHSMIAAAAAMVSTHYLVRLSGVDRATQNTRYQIYFFGIFAIVYFGVLYLPLLWKRPQPPADDSGPTP